MSNVLDVVEGVAEALAETGEDGQIVKTVRTRDPSNPTRMITVTTRITLVCISTHHEPGT